MFCNFACETEFARLCVLPESDGLHPREGFEGSVCGFVFVISACLAEQMQKRHNGRKKNRKKICIRYSRLLLLLLHMMRARARTSYLYACVHGLYLLCAMHIPIGGSNHGVMMRSSLGITSSQTELVVIPEFDLADTAPWL